jgi:hypothetical protein
MRKGGGDIARLFRGDPEMKWTKLFINFAENGGQGTTEGDLA